MTDHTPEQHDSPFVKPTTPDVVIPPLTFEEILNEARLPETKAKICLRADLQAERDEIMGELATLIGPDGTLLAQAEDAEASLGESAEARARELADLLAGVDAQMRAAMRYVRFRGMDSDELAKFNKQWEPKDKKADRTSYNRRLVAATAIEPELTYEQVVEMSGKLGNAQVLALVEAAMRVSYAGGVSVPKLPTISLPQREQ